jgi:fatty acid/phospholipid biosynthesis enzyme
VAHGSSDGKAISSAIRIAERYVLQGLMEKLTRSFVTAEAHLDISQVANGTKAP